MIYITGDVHGGIDISKLNTKNFPSKHLSKKDFLIVSGDFGLVWDNSKEEQFWRKWLEQKPFTTLWIDGNHENFDKLNQLPVEEWNGGKVHKISNSIIHLMRGQVFTLENKTFFTFGGATSHDKAFRKEFVSWWRQELPSYQEYEEGLTNLEKHNWQVDYVVSHTAHSFAIRCLGYQPQEEPMTSFFDAVEEKLNYKHWFFGHYHQDKQIDSRTTVLYQQIIKI